MSPWLSSFVDQMTSINRGRPFYASPDHLGEYILVDYVPEQAQEDLVDALSQRRLFHRMMNHMDTT
jgi:hypothetical protein